MSASTPLIPEAPPAPVPPLLDLTVALLTPHFLLATGNDMARARAIAMESLVPYHGLPAADLLLAAQAIAFGVAALSALGEATAPDMAPTTALRLRANANALSRSAQRAHRALAQLQRKAQPPKPRAEPRLQPATPPRNPQIPAAWANAFADLADQTGTELPNLPPADRHAASIRAAALQSAARALLFQPANQAL